MKYKFLLASTALAAVVAAVAFRMVDSRVDTTSTAGSPSAGEEVTEAGGSSLVAAPARGMASANRFAAPPEPTHDPWSEDSDGGDARQAYAYAMGEAVPPKYLQLDEAHLKALAANGDRHAARRLGDLALNSGQPTAALEAYKTASELGSPAALGMVAALSEPDANMFTDGLHSRFGLSPKPNVVGAYVAAKVAYLRGHRDSYFTLHRVESHLTRQQRTQLDRDVQSEYNRLLQQYIRQHGRPPTIPLDPAGTSDFLHALKGVTG